MDMRILSVLLIISVAGSFGAVESQARTRRSAPVLAGRSPDQLLSRLPRVERDVAPKGESSNGRSSTTPAPRTSTAAPQEPSTRTSSTPKSAEQTPAFTTAAPSSATSPADASTSATTKKPEAPDSKSSTPSSSSNDASAALSPRSSFNDDDTRAADHRASQGNQVSAPTGNMNLPPMNSLSNGNGWASSGAGAFASSSAGGFAGTGSFPSPGGSPYLQGRSGAYQPQVAVDYGYQPQIAVDYGYPQYNPTAGSGFYNPSPFPQNNFADPSAFQRLMEQQFQFFQAQLEAQQRATLRSAHGLLSPRMWDATNSIGGGGFPSDIQNPGFAYRANTAPAGPQSAHSVISVGPRGGFQAGAISPVGPGIESRFADELPPPSGNSFGVFSSSSSSTKVGPDGKQISHKSSTTGINDNGKITFRTVED